MYSGRSYQNDDSIPRYEYDTNARFYNKRVRQYQCCSLLLILCGLLILVFLLVDYAVQNPEIINDTLDLDNGTLAQSNLLKLAPGQGMLTNEDIITDEDIEKALAWSKNELKMKNEQDRLNPQVPVGSAIHKHQQSTAVYQSALELSSKGFVIAKASQKLFSEHPSLKSGDKKLSIPLEESSLRLSYCQQEGEQDLSCKDRMYRTIDGSCNNVDHAKLWGTAMTPFRRLLPADYCDGVFTPRCGKMNEKLPSARLVSTKLHRPEYENDPRFNVMFAVWGQFIDHDISATALTRGNNGEFLSCCGVKTDKMHPECYPVNIPKDDTYYSKKNVTCMDFIRSAPAPTCKFGPREQLNQVSSYLDASVIYGNTDDLAKSLRSFKGGELKMFRTNDGRDLLPMSEDPNDGCNQENEIKRGRYCFLSGDARANENLHLTTMHLIMARQHNFVAKKLMEVNPHWSDEKTYQEARKIVSAQIQHITYNEFLDPLLGSETMKKYDLDGYSNGYYRNYNDSVDASVSNEFATAAFRFAHTLLPGLIKNTGKSLGTEEYTELHRIFFNPFVLYNPGYLDHIIEGAIGTNVEKTDRFFSQEVTEHLFENDDESKKTEKKKTCGLDLVSLNIQRGRDHGLPGYTEWRKECNLAPINSFSDLAGVIDPESITVLTKLYQNVDDIDLYSGALSEYPIEGGMLGPTATCLIAEQFQKLKIGDRFWYENYQHPQAFSIDQLEEIRKVTLSKIICDNADNLTMVPREIMKIGSVDNRHINCNELSEMNFALWTEKDVGPHEQKIQVVLPKELLAEETVRIPSTAAPLKPQSLTLTKSKSSKNVPKMASKTDNLLKYYFTGTIVKGNVTGIKNGEEVVLSDGKFPIPLILDNIADPTGWSSNGEVVFKAQVNGKNIAGTYTMPMYVKNDTDIDKIYMNGKFDINILYKWGGTADFIESNKEYKCLVIFPGVKKSSFTSKSSNILKAAPIEVGQYSCAISLKGYEYQRSFMCNIFPWWCSDSKIFYWNGDIDLSLKINPGNNVVLKQIRKPVDDYINNVHMGLKNIYTGKVSDGWFNLNGNQNLLFPMNINLPLYVNQIINGTNAYLNILGRQILWNCDYFHNSLFGKFYLPYYTNGKIAYKLMGRFSVNIDTQLPLYKLFIPSMQYSTHIHLQDQQTNKMINVTNNDPDNFVVDTSRAISSKLILLGNHTKSNIFQWGGNFIILLEKVPNYYF